MMPKVETFEQDIVEEIKRKDASLAEMSSSSQNGDSAPVELPKKKPVFLIVLAVCFAIFLLGIGGVAYVYFNDPLLNPELAPKTISENDIPKAPQDLAKLAPTLAANIGPYVSKIEKKEHGYALTITNYPAVFAYITRNEPDYINELASLFTTQETQNQTPVQPTLQLTIPLLLPDDTPEQKPTTTPLTATATKNTIKKPTTTVKNVVTKATTTKTVAASSTQATSTKLTLQATTTQKEATTTVSTTTPETQTNTAQSSNVTISNQNIRVWKLGKRSVAYAFVGNTTVIISDTADGVLAVKGATLK